jgi:hypothetical protein
MLNLSEKLDDLILEGHKFRSRLNEISERDLIRIHPYQINLKNRFDIIIKFNLAFDFVHKLNDTFSLDLYAKHIAIFSSGTFKEPYSAKNSLDKYIDDFWVLIDDISSKGFDDNISLVPVSTNFDIIDGSHRVAACMLFEIEISLVKLPLNSNEYDYHYFHKRGIDYSYLDNSLLSFIQRSPNIRVAIIWPASYDSNSREESLQILIDKLDVILIKKLNLNFDSMKLLVLHSYYGADFLGNSANGYRGLERKAMEVFRSRATDLIFFRANSDTEVIKMKNNFRINNSMTHDAIHITDDKIDTIRISSLLLDRVSNHQILNDGLRLNNITMEHFELLEKILRSNEIDSDRIILTGSILFELLGLRPANDIDFIYSGDRIDSIHNLSDNDYFVRLNFDIEELFYNQANYFYFLGFKVLSLENLIRFKSLRAEKRDLDDLAMISKRNLIKQKNNVKDYRRWFFIRLYLYRLRDKFIMFSLSVLKRIKLYEIVRKVYKKFR